MTSRKNIERRRSDVAGSTWRANTTNMNEPYAFKFYDTLECKHNLLRVVVAELPWGSLKAVPNMGVDFGMLPAKFSAQSLMLEFFAVFEKKITSICNDEPLDKALNRSSPLRRTDDVYLDNLLKTLNGVCEICLPSVLSALINWYEQQQKVSLTESGETRDRSVKRTLVASYLFCVVLVEILPQIHFHPTDCEQQVNFIISTAFNQISYRDPVVFGINYNNSLIVAETFAEVIGVLSQSHSKLVQRKFFEMLNDLRKEALTSVTVRNIISLLMGMKFFRIKTQTYADFETGVAFLDELGSYYLEVDLKQKDLKAAYPLLTCLLCISQSKFFLSSWVQFLNLTLANLKNKDPKISRIALESLYRLLWVYIIRNSCEGNTATRSRLESICGSLFPRGNRNVIPRDAPLNIFVKIIHFIAQQKLDFAFKEIIFDLLGCNRASRTISIYPERMNIGIRALMVIADSLQQKEPPPVMPRSIGPITSGTIQRAKKTYLTKPLTADIARTLGLEQYYMPCRKAFDAILRALDTQVGRPLMLTVAQTRGKEYEDIIAGDVRAKLDLLRTCLAAIPRLLPDPMSHQELIEMLIRMLTHIDEELRGSAYQTLQNLMTECVEWREEIVHSFLRFLTTTIQDTYPTLLESTVRFLLQLLCAWKIALNSEKKRENQENLPPGEILSSHNANLKNGSAYPTPPSSKQVVGSISESLPTHSNRNMASSFLGNSTAYALHCIEGFAIVLLCQIRSQMKKLAISLLKEAKQLLVHLCPEQFSESIISERHIRPVIEVLDDATPYVVTKYIEHVPLSERVNCFNV
ncbi:protein furry homolog-like [Ditylenchus destructor]|uniref:Protein furry homolog-like n=1 Tax=Ditylenchus destructor TaxID=166010 RepID=A0AAD4NH36_9BILA|nr:protein furry homolog-like [Ditylenchus destructor]